MTSGVKGLGAVMVDEASADTTAQAELGATEGAEKVAPATSDADKAAAVSPAEQRVKNLEEKLERLTREAREAQSNRDKARSEAEKIQAELLKRVVDIAEKNNGSGTQQEAAAKREALIKALDENLDGKSVLELQEEAIRTAVAQATRFAEEKVQRLEEQLKAFNGRVEDYDPEWQANKGRIEELKLTEKFPGADRKTLVQIAKLVKAPGDMPPRADIPGTTFSGVRTGDDAGSPAVTQAEWAEIQKALGGVKLTPEQKASVEARYKGVRK